MRVAAALILCAITLARGQEVELNENGCPIDYRHELLYAHEICNKFYQCTHGELVVHTCARELLFNVDKQECDWPHDTDCGHRVIPGPESEENVKEVSTEDNATQKAEWDNNGGNLGDNYGNGENGSDGDNNNGGNGDGDNGNENGTGSCNCNPGEAPSICAGNESEGVLIAHENCNQFYTCANGVPVAMSCYGDLLYNPYTEHCDWPRNVECGDRVIPECDDDDNNNGENGSGGDKNNGGNGDGDNGNENGTGSCNCNPGEAPSICADSGSEGVLISHENCNQFYKCSHGIPVAMSCSGDLLYNPYTEQCDWPRNVECGDREIPECDDDNNNNEENGSGGDNNNGGNGDGDNGNENGTGSCNCNPGEAPSICAGSESEGVLIAHENCNQFYTCANGVPVAMSCYGDLLYNPYTEQCDWPRNVECGDRVIPECDDDNNNNGENDSGGDKNNGGNGDGDNGNENGTGSCNCNPGEAPSICADSGSEGVLIAHENCNQFYKCSHGIPVAMSCSGDLLYNPYTELCDWPRNVECGDRVIPECDDDNNNNEENGSGGDNNNGGNGDGDNGNENGTGSCNCNPGEAPSICAGSESEGVLIAHENCNQFYTCANGVPVAMSCYGDLLYNPYTEQCDWPRNVECGDRVIPECDDDNNNNGENGSGGDNNNGGNGDGDNGNENGTGSCNCNPGEAPSICADSGSEGVLIAHENCNQFYKCSHGIPVAMSCSGDLLYNPYTEQCDWPRNVECGDRVIPECDDDNNNNEENGSGGDNNNGGNGDGDNDNENGTGSCNCNPGEAPSICAGSGSDSVLIAHENCNQFYKCSHGVPISMSCYGDLLYNPYTEQCDWPRNVECGDRVIPECDDDNNNNGDNGSSGDNNNGGNGDGDNGNENGTGSCNCNPDDAPSICAGIGSEGTLIAHENCNQFYICSHGVPVSMSCFRDLLYNPYTERCDWPSNVECGDRVIPDYDYDNNNNGENGSSGDNNNGGNGDGDNGNENGTGSCNCNPGEAPSICAGSGSEGVLIAHENCNQFYTCANGVPVAMSCYGDLLYNPYTEQCDWPRNVECGDRVIPECDDDNNNNGENGSGGDNNNGGNGDGDNGNENGTGSCNCNPGEAPSICADSGSEGVLIAHENCNQFYKCSHGIPVAMSCSGDLLYNPYTEQCDWPRNVECGVRVIPECDDDNNNNEENGSGGDNNNGGNGDGDNGNENGTGSCNCNPGEAPSICAGSGSDGVLIAHENCNQFYKCSHGVPISMSCYGDLLYNPYTEQCDWPRNVECGDRVIPECDDDNNNNGENGSSGDNNNGGNGDGDNGNENGTGSCNCNPDDAPSICAGIGSEGTLIAHENCNQFYICSHGVPVSMSCFRDLLYNPYTERCDWPSNVECGDRVIPDYDDDNNNNGENGSSGDNNNGGNGDGDNGNENGTGSCNCNPGEAPSICADSGSEGVLIAHENCNQFYKCSHGIPVAMSCSGDLLYNPNTEQCDWPRNVECGDRVIPECDDDNNNNEENGSGGDNNNGGNGDGDNGNENGTGSCNCNPGEAPSICAGSGSDGVLIAHENCNQFYKCSHGVPISMSCYGDLLYNPYTEQCDWPRNVECGDRVIPECADDNNNNGENGSGADNNNGGNGDGDKGNENGTGSCNCSPGEAPSICAGSGSEGMLIAHENCDQFYMCSNGIPVTFNCTAALLYNPYKQVCDWPENVDCNGRSLSYFTSMNKHLSGRKLQTSIA